MNKKKKLKLLHISHLSKVIFYIFALNSLLYNALYMCSQITFNQCLCQEFEWRAISHQYFSLAPLPSVLPFSMHAHTCSMCIIHKYVFSVCGGVSHKTCFQNNLKCVCIHI